MLSKALALSIHKAFLEQIELVIETVKKFSIESVYSYRWVKTHWGLQLELMTFSCMLNALCSVQYLFGCRNTHYKKKAKFDVMWWAYKWMGQFYIAVQNNSMKCSFWGLLFTLMPSEWFIPHSLIGRSCNDVTSWLSLCKKQGIWCVKVCVSVHNYCRTRGYSVSW